MWNQVQTCSALLTQVLAKAQLCCSGMCPAYSQPGQLVDCNAALQGYEPYVMMRYDMTPPYDERFKGCAPHDAATPLQSSHLTPWNDPSASLSS